MRRLILFVHGLGGDPGSTWGEFARLVDEDAQLDGYETAFVNQPSSMFRAPFGRVAARIGEFAKALGSEIESRFAQFDEIVLVGHSMGGLVARKYLVEQMKGTKPLRVSGALLYACPNEGSSLAGIAKRLAWRHHQLAQLRPGSEFIDQLNSDWATLDCCGTVSVRNVVAVQDRYVTARSAAPPWQGASSRTVADRGHSDVVKPNSAGDSSYIHLRDFVLTVAAGAHPAAAVRPPGSAGAPAGTNAPDVPADPLFSVYSLANDDYYLPRPVDGRVDQLLRHRSFWLTGDPGCGKTACAMRALSRRFRRWHMIALADLTGSGPAETLEALHDRIRKAIGGDDEPREDDLVDAIARRLDDAAASGVEGFLVEEVPLQGEDLITFCGALRAVTVRHAARAPGVPVRVIISSNLDPGRAFAGNDPGAESYVVLRMENWNDDEIGGLVALIVSGLDIEFDAQAVSRVLECASGSPRFVKMFFVNLLALGPGSLERALASTRAELIG